MNHRLKFIREPFIEPSSGWHDNAAWKLKEQLYGYPGSKRSIHRVNN